MYLHTRREKEAAAIFGVTDPFGVTLINRAHPFPLLVEEEEKTHGALLANTTHGALYRALGSIFPEPNSNITFQQSPDEDITDLEPLEVFNRIRFLKDRVLSRALSVHEAFAKYCAFCFQYATATERPVPELDRLWVEETARYGLLLDLARVIAEPATVTLYHSVFNIAYTAAKAVLNVADLDTLLAIRSPRQLYEKLASRSSGEALEERFSVVMAAIEAMRATSAAEFGRVLSGETRLDAVLIEALKRAGLHAQREVDPGTLSARSVLLGKRLESLAAGALYCHLDARHLGWAMGSWIDLDDRFLHPDGSLKVYATAQSLGGVPGSDPSLTVSYDSFAGGDEWPEGELAQHALEETRETIVYLAYGGSETIDCYAIVQPRENAEPAMFVDHGHDWETLEPQLARVGRARLAIVLLPTSFGVSVNVPATQILGEALAHLGTVAYWNPTSSPSQIVDAESFLYAYRGLTGTPDLGPRGPAGLLSIGSGYVIVGAAPLYAIDMVSKILSVLPEGPWLHQASRRITARINRIDEIVFDAGAKRVPAEIVAAARVYEHFYELGKLPGPIPFYNAMNLFNTIYEATKGD